MASGHGNSSKSASMWIHCNRCFENYIQKQKRIFILSCYDVACENCLCRVNQMEFKCPVCEKLVKGYPIGNNLSSNLKEIFHPRPWTLNFQKACAIVKFQTKQRDKFLTGCRKMAAYNNSLEMKRDRVKTECRQAYFLQQKTRHERKQLENGLKKFFEKTSSYQRVGGSRSSRRNDHFIHPTFSASRNEVTFDFPSDSHLSKSFML